MGDRPYHDRETLKRLYHVEGLSQREIADRFDVGQKTISNWVRKHGLQFDGRTEPYQDADTLRRLYHEEGMSQAEIAEKFGVADNTISEWFSKLDITARPFKDKPYKSADVLRYLHQDEGLTWEQIAERFGVGTSTIQYWMRKHDIETHGPNRDRYDIPEDELRELYAEKEWPQWRCAEHFGCSENTIHNRLQRYGIPIRTTKESHRIRTDEYARYSVHGGTGYPRLSDRIARREVSVHQLTAIAGGADPYKVFSDGDYMIHHKNTYRFDNRPANLELVTESQHMATHRRDVWTTRDGWPELVTARPSEE